jgi:hypothetical protein
MELDQKILDAASPVLYRVPAENLPTLAEKLAKLNKRAAKIGTRPITFTSRFLETVKWTETMEGGYTRERATEIHEVALIGAVAVVPGFIFLAAIHHTDDGNILAKAPHAGELDPKWRTASPSCDHCGVTRRRNSTYLLLDATGAIRQVGRQCLQDFTGHHDPFAVASWAEAIAAFAAWVGGLDEDEVRRSSGASDPAAGLKPFLDLVATVIRLDGWTSRGAARDRDDLTATATTAWSAYWATPRYDSQLIKRYVATKTEEDEALAQRTLDWARTLIDRDGLNDYLYNLSVVARSELVNYRTNGLAASMIQAYRKEVERQEETKRDAARAPSAHVGTVGERIRGLKVTVRRRTDLEPNDYGPRTLLAFVDDAGNDLTWFTGATGAEVGEVYWLTGTVKAHGEYKGRLQTTVARCVLDLSAPPVKPAKKAKRPA